MRLDDDDLAAVTVRVQPPLAHVPPGLYARPLGRPHRLPCLLAEEPARRLRSLPGPGRP